VAAADVEPRAIEWLWRPWIPLGRLTLLVGDPGAGKSTITCALAAAVSRGTPLPGDDAPVGPRDVLMISAEDGIDDTIRPRLEAAEADLRRVHVLEGFEGDAEWLALKYPAHLAALEAKMGELHPALVIVDPLTAYLGDTDSSADARVRSILGPLARLGDEYDSAILAVMHLNKAVAMRGLHRIGGSIGFGAAARSVLLAGSEPDAPEATALVHLKSNLAAYAQSEGYRIISRVIPRVPRPVETSRIEWTGRSDLTAERIFAQIDGDGGSHDEAENFLSAELANGPMGAEELIKRADKLGISKPRLKRAKKRLGIESRKTGYEGGWEWVPRGSPSSPSIPSSPSSLSGAQGIEGVQGTEGIEGYTGGPLARGVA
jgi:hypothetical protein